jgi:hypothetical protein
MTLDPSGKARLPHVNDLPVGVATAMIARAVAEAFQAPPEEPIPEPLAAILRQIQAREDDHERHAA